MTIESEVFSKMAQHLRTSQLLPGSFSALSRAQEVVLASDYVDDVGPFQTLAFLVTTAEGWREWKARRDKWRQGAALNGRRMTYTKLDDPHCKRSIAGFLHAAGALDGTLFTVAIERANPEPVQNGRQARSR